MSSVFPILSTPQLVLRTIIDVAEPNDLVALSMCSKRMWRLIKFHWNKKNKYELNVNPDRHLISFEHKVRGAGLFICFNYSEINMTQKTEYVEIMGFMVFASFGDDCIRTYWMNEQFGTQTIIDYICDLFTMDIQRLSMQKPNAWFIYFIKNRQSRPLNEVFVDTVTLTEEETKLILTLNSNEMLVHAHIPENFQFNGTLLKYEWLHFAFGYWVTLDHLMNSEIPEFSIRKSKLTEHDMNQFLKHLIAGGCPQLKFLSVGIYDINIQNLFVDIQDKVVEVTEKRTITAPSRRRYTFDKSFDIRNEGGTLCSVGWYWLDTSLIIAVRPGDSQIG